MAVNYRDFPEAYENTEARCPVVLVLDVSGSMSGEPIRQLNEGLRVLKKALEDDPTASLRVEVAVVTFGASVSLAHDFATMDAFNPPTLSADGGTPMGEGLEYALQLVAERKEQYKNHGLKYYQPWVWLITDGYPNGNSPWQEAAQKIHQEHKNKKISFFAVAVEGADMNQLKQVSPPDRTPVKLNGLDFKTMFLWLSRSVGKTASGKVGEEGQTKLEPIGWGSV
ncbi:MAG: hypothetical protein AUK48_09915 [Oscillatoriales cyanobacterium CG2_30_44_21]|nr:MAG: hypothetical protein AUK48_09915 [Oscillatoriales cyanobacterium CG2_30_44_21]